MSKGVNGDGIIQVLSLVGLLASFVGSVLLSVGLIKTEQEVRDEEQPYWGVNPFRLKGALSSRKSSVAGFALVISGFATELVTGLFSVFDYQSLLGAVGFSIALSFGGWLLTIWFVGSRLSKHVKSKQDHHQDSLTQVVKSLIKNYDAKLVPNEPSYNFQQVKFDHIHQLVDYLPRIGHDVYKVLSEAIGEMRGAEGMKAMRDSLAELDKKLSS